MLIDRLWIPNHNNNKNNNSIAKNTTMIIYTAIGREDDGAVLVESSHEGIEGNFPLIATQLLEKLRDDPCLVPNGNRKTFIHREEDLENGSGSDFVACGSDSLWGLGASASSWFGGAKTSSGATSAGSAGAGAGAISNSLDHYFHVLHGESAFYICLSDDTGRQTGVNFSYLEDLRRDFAGKYTPNKINRANAYGMSKAFRPAIEKLAHHYNVNREDMATDQRVLHLSSQVDDLKNVVGKNISMVLQRGESIGQLATKSEQMEADASVFKKRSTTLKKKMWWENLKMNTTLIMVVVAIIVFLGLAICGGGKCKASD